MTVKTSMLRIRALANGGERRNRLTGVPGMTHRTWKSCRGESDTDWNLKKLMPRLPQIFYQICWSHQRRAQGTAQSARPVNLAILAALAHTCTIQT